MRERNAPDDAEMVPIHLGYEFYLKGKEDPVHFAATFELRRDVLVEDAELESFMDIAVKHVLGTLDTVGEHRLIFSDDHFNKFVAITDQVQAVSILAPSEEALLARLNKE